MGWEFRPFSWTTLIHRMDRGLFNSPLHLTLITTGWIGFLGKNKFPGRVPMIGTPHHLPFRRRTIFTRTSHVQFTTQEFQQSYAKNALLL